jgi:lysyl-tRNA synthetase class 2
MKLVEEMFRHVATTAFGRTQFKVRGHDIDFSLPWTRVSMTDAVRSKTGVDFYQCKSVAEANERLDELKISEPQPSIGEALVRAFEVLVEPGLIHPTLVFGHPVEISPLAKPMADDPRFAERFEIFIAGMECGDNWSEQNDPVHLMETWKKAYREDERDSGKFHTLDFDFIEALEYGMPPTTGIGPGIERMAMIFTQQENIDDVIFFPLMRPSISPLNAGLYGVRETSVKPAEDMVLTFDEFEALCNDGVLAPQTNRLVVSPHVRIWPVQAPPGQWRASGYVEVEGFFSGNLLRLAGYTVNSKEPLHEAEELRKLVDVANRSLGSALRKTSPGCKIEVLLPGDSTAS